jgi:hypothetical protein
MDAANAIKQLCECVIVEAALGDVIETTKRIQFGLFDDPNDVKENPQSSRSCQTEVLSSPLRQDSS